MNRKYSGFTLVEMLIVMGIIIILMAVGITAGRFAIQRANDVAHQDAADKLFVAAQAYMTDMREYPDVKDWDVAIANDGNACADPCLEEYLSGGEFEGGTDATFYYWTDTKSAVVCVSLGGIADEDDRGYYCSGNGISADGGPAGVDGKDIAPEGTGTPDGFPGTSTAASWNSVQVWTNDTSNFGANSGTYVVQ